MRELVRSIEGVSGTVPMRWRVRAAVRLRRGTRRAASGATACRSRPGAPKRSRSPAGMPATPPWRDDGVEGRFEIAAGGRALLALASAYAEPLVLPAASAVADAARRPRSASGQSGPTRARYDGPWADARPAQRARAQADDLRAVRRIGRRADHVAARGDRRRAQLGLPLLLDSRFELHDRRAAAARMPRRGAVAVLVVHAGDGADRAGAPRPVSPRRRRRPATSASLALTGYRGSRAGARRQRRARAGRSTTSTARCSRPRGSTAKGSTRSIATPARVLARIADHVCDIWRRPDSGIWEVRNGPFHFTHSKVMCWVALDRAVQLADARRTARAPRRRAGGARRRRSATSSNAECWSDAAAAATRASPAASDVDASLLMLPLVGYGDPHGERIRGTIDAVNRLLRDGDFVYRYHADDGVAGGEGSFLNCSFWLVSALARVRPRRRGDRADGSAGRARQRRRAVLRGNRSATAAPFSATFRRRSSTSRSIDAAIAAVEVRGAASGAGVTRRSRPRSPAAFSARSVLTTVIKAASELALTRMDLALLLGTTVTDNRRKARAIGYVFHFVLGILFALAYGAFFADHRPQHRGGSARCSAPLHAVFTATVARQRAAADRPSRAWRRPTQPRTRSTLIEPPGFLMLNYGRSTFLVTLVAHIAYGAIVGADRLSVVSPLARRTEPRPRTADITSVLYHDLVFQRRTTGSVVCPSCGSLVGVRDDKCYSCGRSNPGLWGFGPVLRQIGADLGFAQLVVGTCVTLWVITLLMSGSGYPRRQPDVRCCRRARQSCSCSARAAPIPVFGIGPMVDRAQRRLAARRPAAHPDEHVLGVADGAGDGRHARTVANGHHLHGRRRHRIRAELVCRRVSCRRSRSCTAPVSRSAHRRRCSA